MSRLVILGGSGSHGLWKIIATSRSPGQLRLADLPGDRQYGNYPTHNYQTGGHQAGQLSMTLLKQVSNNEIASRESDV